MRYARILSLIYALLSACAAPGPDSTDLGQLPSGKGDLFALQLDLPCLDPSGGTGDSAVVNFMASGAFLISLSQPEVPGGQQAEAQLELVHDQGTSTSASGVSPELLWDAFADEFRDYTLTVANRSSDRTLCSRLRLEALAPYVPPQARRTFSSELSFSPGATSVPVAFFDADSTLRVSKSGAVAPNGPEDVVLLPGVAGRIRQAAATGMLIAIVSNQGGVSYGYLTFADAESAMAQTARLIGDRYAPIHYFDFATSYTGNDRKPKTGMAVRLEQQLQSTFNLDLDWQGSYMVGDSGWKKGQDIEPDGTPGEDVSNSDRLFAEALGIPFFHPRDYFGWADYGVRNFHSLQQVTDFQQAHPDYDE